MYICVCKAVTDSQIKCAMHAGMKSRRELYNCLGIGGNCGKCVPQVKELIENHHESLMHNSANPSILAA